MEIADNIERAKRFMDLDGKFRTAMLTCTAGRADAAVFQLLAELESGYGSLLEDAGAEDALVSADDLRQRIADVSDWRARALETARRFDEAIEAFDRAARLFAEAGKVQEAQRSRDRANGLRLETTADFDAEIKRLRDRLERGKPGSLDRVEVLVALGELHGKANDDFEAIHHLETAEAELEASGGHPSDAELLGSLRETVQRIQAGQQVAGASSIEAGIQRRALTQRLLLALGNAYRTTDPARAAEYEERLRALGDRKASNFRGLLRKYLDAGQDVTKFLKSLSGER